MRSAQHDGPAPPQHTERLRIRRGLITDRGLLALAGLSLVLFGLITLFVLTQPPQTLDLPISREAQELDFGPINWLLQAVSWPGYTPYNWIFPALTVMLLAVLRRRVEAAYLLLTSAASLLGSAVKVLVGRDRPLAGLVNVIGNPTGYSFPSGHVTQYTLFFGFCLYLAWTLLQPGMLRTIVLTFCAALVLLVGPSRIWLGAHWASDVLGGYTLAMGLLLLIICGYRRWRSRRTGGPAMAGGSGDPI